MKRGVIILFALLVLPFIPCSVFGKKAAEKIQKQTYRTGIDIPGISLRMPPKKKIDQFKKDPAFVYEREGIPNTFWDDIEAWINKKLEGFFKQFSIPNPFKIIYVQIASIAVFAALFAFFILKIFRVSLFYRTGKNSGQTMEDIVEEMTEVDLETLIEDFIRMREYRHAVRLMYHKSLRDLSKMNIITQKRDKTNGDYLNEIRDEGLKKGFRNITRLFEYIWYGNFCADEKSFEKIIGAFGDFSRRMQAQ